MLQVNEKTKFLNCNLPVGGSGFINGGYEFINGIRIRKMADKYFSSVITVAVL
jgi:hypothetical protein